MEFGSPPKTDVNCRMKYIASKAPSNPKLPLETFLLLDKDIVTRKVPGICPSLTAS